jgi:alpha-amylase
MRAWLALLGLLLSAMHCGAAPAASQTSVSSSAPTSAAVSVFWRNATIYFLLTDRFHNGERSNDCCNTPETRGSLLRGFEGGDIAGVTEKIRAGYFNRLGVDAIWTTPLVENVQGHVGEAEWGKTYAYHGYWTLDWTAVDPRFGSAEAMREMVRAAHAQGIRVIADVVLNHAGTPSAQDPKWPASWVRPGPTCDYKSYAGTVSCEMHFTLQDILTESDEPVDVPDFLIEKWRREGRLSQEMMELDAFFARTKLPRAPKHYIVKWLTDWVRDYGIDGFRVDTAKHADPEVWPVLKREAIYAQQQWRAANPDRIQPDQDFYMVGEVYDYGLDGFKNAAARGRAYEYGDRSVDFFDYGFDALINMAFPTHAKQNNADLFARYGRELASRFRGRAMVNYISSHDDMQPFDGARTQAFEAASKLMLAPGSVQIYYGDEISRSLVVPGATGDSTLRSNFDWAALDTPDGQAILQHWQRLGRFRQAHPAIGAGTHEQLQKSPLVFARSLAASDGADAVVVALALKPGAQRIPVAKVFADGSWVRDAYSDQRVQIRKGQARFRTPHTLALLESASAPPK